MPAKTPPKKKKKAPAKPKKKTVKKLSRLETAKYEAQLLKRDIAAIDKQINSYMMGGGSLETDTLRKKKTLLMRSLKASKERLKKLNGK